MSDTVVTLSCPNHSTFFLDKLWSYYQEKYKVDVEIRSKGQAIFAHQLVISIFCPKLKSNLDSNLFSADKLLTVSDVTDDGDLLAILLEFMYKGKVSVEEEKLADLKNAAKKLGIDGLVDAIDKITKENDERKVITPKKSSVRRRKAAKPVKTLLFDEEISEDDDFDDDWSERSERRQSKPSKRTKVSNQEAKNANNEASVADSNNAVTTKNNTEKKRQWRLKLKLNEKPPQILTCATCGKNFRNKLSFDRHIMCHNNDSRLHRCERCSFRTANKSDLVEHLGSVHMVDLQGNPLAEIKCEQCDYKCFTKQRLKKHTLRQHTDKSHKCDKCNYSAVEACDLVKHIRVKHENVRSYQCDVCGKGFKTTSSLNSHSRSHTGIKPYVCEACGQEFAQPDRLKCHMLKHEGDKKPFVCHICGKCCRRRDNLQMHLRRIHKTNDMSLASLCDKSNSKSTENSEADQTTAATPNAPAQPDELAGKSDNRVADQTNTTPNTSALSEYAAGFHNAYIGFVTWMPKSHQ